MKTNRRPSSLVLPATTALLWLGAVAMALPFWVMLVTSLLSPAEAQTFPPKLWPANPQWHTYTRLFETLPMARYALNSLWVAGVTTVVHTVLCAMAAYGFSRLQFAHKNKLFFLFLMTLMIPPTVNIVPLFVLMKTFGWVDTYWGLIVPGLFGAFGVFLLRQWFNGLPAELEEAARMDGANPWQIFWQIALPLSTPALAALGIFVFIGSWNNLMWPLIVTHSEAMRTLPLGVATLKSSFRDTTDWPLLMAASAVSIIPVVLVFLAGQKQFIQGILMGGVKE